MPNARIKLNSTIMFMVMPMSFRSTKDRNMDAGIETATNIDVPAPRKNSRMTTIRIRPLTMLFSRLETISSICSDMSDVITIDPDGGISGSIASTSAFTAAAVSMMFWPERFTTSSVTTALPSMRANVSRSANPKSTVATSRT